MSSRSGSSELPRAPRSHATLQIDVARGRSIHQSPRRLDAVGSGFRRTAPGEAREAILLPHRAVGAGETLCVTPRQTCPRPKLRAQLAFKDSMVHGILQFTPSIAFRYVLHRCE